MQTASQNIPPQMPEHFSGSERIASDSNLEFPIPKQETTPIQSQWIDAIHSPEQPNTTPITDAEPIVRITATSSLEVAKLASVAAYNVRTLRLREMDEDQRRGGNYAA